MFTYMVEFSSHASLIYASIIGKFLSMYYVSVLIESISGVYQVNLSFIIKYREPSL